MRKPGILQFFAGIPAILATQKINPSMKPSMTLQQFISIFSTTAVLAWALNLVWLAILSVPLTFLWNHAVVPLGSLSCLTYGRVYSLLLFWFLLRLTQTDVKLSLK